MIITDTLLHQIMPTTSPAKRTLYLPFLNAAMAEFDINTKLRAAAFLAQLAHESAELRYMEELASGSAYEGRKDLGNVKRGDGKRFKGRGPIQLTGRANYVKYGKLLDIDLENNPELAATPEVGFRIAGQFWKLNHLNEFADRQEFKHITRAINGGYNGLEARTVYYEKAQRVLPNDPISEVAEIVPEVEPPHKPDIKTTEDDGNKGSTTSAVADTTTVAGTPPPAPAVDVKPSQPSWQSRVSTWSMPTGMTAVIGVIWKYAQNVPPWGWIVLASIFVIAMILTAWIHNESQKRANDRTLKVMGAAEDKNKNNLRII